MAPPPAQAQSSALTAPINLVSERPPWRNTFVSLKVRNYRLFASAHMVSMTALWMQRIAQDWLVLQLSGSVTAVGITVAMQFTPSLVLMPLGGMIADRYSKRKILMISQSTAGLLAALMAVLALTGVLSVWHIYAIAFVLGLVTVIDQPARQVFVNELVGPANLRNAISVNSSIFQIGGMVGPAVSGILISAVGGGWAFAANAFACFCTVFTLCCLRPGELVRSAPAPRSKGQLREGLQLCPAQAHHLLAGLMARFVAVFAMSLPVLMAAYANNVFHTGAGGYGLLNTLVATRCPGRRARLDPAPRSCGCAPSLAPPVSYGLMLALAQRPRPWRSSAASWCWPGSLADLPDLRQPVGPDQHQRADPWPGDEPVHHGADRRPGHRRAADRLAGRAPGSAAGHPGGRRRSRRSPLPSSPSYWPGAASWR